MDKVYKSTHDVLREHLYRQLGFMENKRVIPPLEELRETQWSPRFEKCMRDRLIMGGIRHGFLKEPGKPQYDRLSDMEDRIKLYRKTGNDELLADIANLSLLEFEEGVHPLKHFKALDDTKHAKVV